MEDDAKISITDKRIRTPNFSFTEKQLLTGIIYKYKDIIENKKTDAVTNDEKNKAWDMIENDFNSSCPEGRRRPANSLKKFFSNKKKELRKTVAEQRKERFLTGGGVPTIKIQDKNDELLLSIINEKTIIGLNNMFDSDAPNDLDYNISSPGCSNDGDICIGSEVEILTEDAPIEEEALINSHPQKKIKLDETSISSSPTWRSQNFKASMLNTPISRPLTNAKNRRLQTAGNTSRRRPSTVVKPLTSSLIGEKYDILVTQRIKIAAMEEQKLKNELELQQLQKQSTVA